MRWTKAEEGKERGRGDSPCEAAAREELLLPAEAVGDEVRRAAVHVHDGGRELSGGAIATATVVVRVRGREIRRVHGLVGEGVFEDVACGT